VNRASTGARFAAGPALKVVLVVALAVTLVVTGTVLRIHSGNAAHLSAKDRIAADPPPPLFGDPRIAPTATAIAAVRADAADRVRAWAATHGTHPDDAAFVAWVERTFPPPPADLGAQLPQVIALSRTRTAGGVKAATWLEAHGKKDLWKLEAHDQGELLAPARAQAVKKEEKAALRLSKQIADSLGARFGSSAPYVRRPALRPDHHVAAGQKCPCSYPSRHATAGAASETLLGHLQPYLDPQYRHLEAEIDYSRVYMAGHFPGDITAGALLGDLIGDYLLVTREGVDPATL
jgi:membrane-associated phospholipid phosphatase